MKPKSLGGMKVRVITDQNKRVLNPVLLLSLSWATSAMLDFETAKKMVEEQINLSYHADDDELVVVDGGDYPKGVRLDFFYTSRRFIETRDPNDMVVGNAPIVVNKQTGTLTWLGTAEPLENSPTAC